MSVGVCGVVYLFYEFDKFWFAEKPADIMQFNVVKDKFVTLVSEELHAQTAQLKLDLTSSWRPVWWQDGCRDMYSSSFCTLFCVSCDSYIGILVNGVSHLFWRSWWRLPWSTCISISIEWPLVLFQVVTCRSQLAIARNRLEEGWIAWREVECN